MNFADPWFVEWRPTSSDRWVSVESFESEAEAYGYVLGATAEDPSVLLRVVPNAATAAGRADATNGGG